jgi:hypothetical protein
MTRKIYYRRKGDKIIIEGKQDGRSVLIWTLPAPETLLNAIIEKASFFTQEKSSKILSKLQRLDQHAPKPSKRTHNIPLIKINRNPEKDAFGDI